MEKTNSTNGTYLIINPGSTSTCYTLYTNEHEQAYAYFLNRFSKFEMIYRSSATELSSDEQTKTISQYDYEHSSELFLKHLKQLNIINEHNDITRVGLRVVAPGTFFTQHRIIDDAYEAKLKQAAHLDPLHIEPLLRQLVPLKKLLPGSFFYGLSDSAFHQTMPDIARFYALPVSIMSDLDIYRFGYHGLACASVVRILKQNGHDTQKTIICHLGGGTSITAIKNKKSIDTSMGFSPLEGLPMATRSGDVDANALLYIMEHNSLKPDDLRNFLYTQCGLLGLSGTTGDMRQIGAAITQGDHDSQKAVAVYVYAIQKCIGAYATILGGLDTLVLTGGISVHLPFIRALICNINFLNMKIDETKNNDLVAKDGFIESSDSKVKVAVVAPNEEREMYAILKNL